ncbi:MAG: alpha/beta hydrolase [Parvibaculum sp.]|uniref:alpha/beta fold hydrolase n=1 Tax=Parvibaculum sp. TaxID=2024848 RepID=UPI003C738413
MPRIKTNGLRIEYESLGSAKSEAVLLIMGLGAQLTQWPAALCEKLVERGYRVIRFDNRDVGLSSKITKGSKLSYSEMLASLGEGKSDFAPYSLADMASDAIGLLDGLKIDKAHIVGMAMGGMIAQTIAAEYPDRTLSLTSIASTSGNPDLPGPEEEVLRLMLSPAPVVSDLSGIVARDIELNRLIGSPDYPTEAATLKEWAMRDALRAYYPAGILRQMAAAMSGGDRRAALAKIKAPTVVLHGAADRYIPVAAGEDTAKNIPGAELRVVPGMGHDLPTALAGTVAEAIVAAAERATGPRPAVEAGATTRNDEAGKPGPFSRMFRRFRRAIVPA